MTKKDVEKIKQIKEKQGGVEKPVSLWGAPFRDVLDALLKTKPMPKEEKTNRKPKGDA